MTTTHKTLPKIALVGYGKMGKEIAQVCKEKNISIVAIIDPIAPEATAKELSVKTLNGADVAIDFTIPSIVMKNMSIYGAAEVNVVMGTTGWYDKMSEVESLIDTTGIGMIWSGNFSIGVHLFKHIIQEAAKKVNHITDYDTFMYEIHHRQKADSPSGTAEMIAHVLINELDAKKTIVRDKLDRAPKSDELHVASVRGGSVFGVHTVAFDSLADTIELTHTARSRRGFANGAVQSAVWITDKKGLFTIDDFMTSLQQK